MTTPFSLKLALHQHWDRGSKKTKTKTANVHTTHIQLQFSLKQYGNSPLHWTQTRITQKHIKCAKTFYVSNNRTMLRSESMVPKAGLSMIRTVTTCMGDRNGVLQLRLCISPEIFPVQEPAKQVKMLTWHKSKCNSSSGNRFITRSVSFRKSALNRHEKSGKAKL